MRVWRPTWLGSVVMIFTKHLTPKVQVPPAGLGVRGDATLQTPAFTAVPCGVHNDSRSFSGLERVAFPTGAGAGAQPALGTDPCSRWVPSLPSRDLVGSSLSPGVRDTTGNAMSQGVILPAVETASSGSHARRAAARMPVARQHFGSCTLG
ncbi:hypothetical protein HPB47_026801 [Ixodes persulcatus]|uniref:Uncharacterized protein n=1 Tax=Ixodes persulcatus TaxID=34615 RepID=A0AC60PXN3_IXOPE|nr:hypothetical protein HPB47_026801 [Ixodes persulcatus]